MINQSRIMTVTGRSPKRFTLVELLFVIGIIMILMSLLLPALRSAKEHGRRTVCTTQERQIALGYGCNSQKKVTAR